MMKKRTLLTALVLLSIMQGSVYASINNDGYEIGRLDSKAFSDDTNVFRNNDTGIAFKMNPYSSATIGKDNAINKFESGKEYTFDDNGNIIGVSGSKGDAINASFIKNLEIIGKETYFYGNINISSLSGPLTINSNIITVDGNIDIDRTSYTTYSPTMSITGDKLHVTGDFKLNTWSDEKDTYDEYTIDLTDSLNIDGDLDLQSKDSYKYEFIINGGNSDSSIGGTTNISKVDFYLTSGNSNKANNITFGDSNLKDDSTLINKDFIAFKTDLSDANTEAGIVKIDGYNTVNFVGNVNILDAYQTEVIANNIIILGEAFVQDKITTTEWINNSKLELTAEKYINVVDGIKAMSGGNFIGDANNILIGNENTVEGIKVGWQQESAIGVGKTGADANVDLTADSNVTVYGKTILDGNYTWEDYMKGASLSVLAENGDISFTGGIDAIAIAGRNDLVGKADMKFTNNNKESNLVFGNSVDIGENIDAFKSEGNVDTIVDAGNIKTYGNMILKDNSLFHGSASSICVIGKVDISDTEKISSEIKNGIDLNINKGAIFYNGVNVSGENSYFNIESSGSNQINILSNNKSVWASGDGGTVNITGAVNINAKYTGTDGTSLLADDEGQHIAIVAGVAGVDSLETNHGEVNVTLKGTDDSHITGDIVAARDGIVNITHEDYTGKLYITGDVLAGNGRIDSNDQQLGVANVDLGEGGYWAGRADDYQDAALKADSTYFDPHFTDGKVDAAGKVNITMGEGSVWNVTGQSWVTNLKGDKSTIILCGKDTSGNIKGTGGYSIHIGALEGENTFVVNLNPEDVAGSDMIYIQDGTNAKQTLLVNNESDLLNLQEGERIRFATIADAEGSFEYGGTYSGTGTFGETYTVKGRGLRNVELGVQYVAMDQEDEVEDTYHDVGTEEAYNGGSSFTESNDKPGSSYVEDTYYKVDEDKNSQNVYLVRGEGSSSNPGDDDDLTDSGETIVNMSHANYKNAVYMDRLNKRLGEARYIDGDEGMWVRLRHDRIGMKDEFRSMNTMYQLGYDKLDNKDDKGERHIGAAIDYMDGSTSYSDIYGEGETKRWGFWMYDTWLGSKGHYADYIVKFGHLHNDFDLSDKDSGEKVTGDYDNNVFSISAEYGRKKDIGNDWYIEPQAQLQLARVTDAEYTTSQGTDVYVDGINSLIGRIGFRLGKDVDERSTVYVKADVLHEFLGDQRIVAGDVTGALDKTYENSGTWYDVGFGFATAVGHNSYAYLDFEKSFGNDNDETYQINAGLQWSF